MTAAPVTASDVRRRSNTELGLLVLAVLVILCAYALVGLAQTETIPPGLLPYAGSMTALAIAAHLVSRRLAKGADPLLLPLAFLLNGLGLVMVRRLDFAQDSSLAPAQTVWAIVAVAVFVATLVIIRDHTMLDRYRYIIGISALAFLLMPLLPFIGKTVNGSRIWLRLGGMSFQPGEVAKIGLVAFFASYLAEKRGLLSVATNRLGPFHVPPARAFGPILFVWGVSLSVLVFQKDLGLSLLVFGIFVLMLYIATGRPAYALAGAALFAAGATVAWRLFTHVQDRVGTWLDPWEVYETTGYQVAQSLFAMGTGGMFGVGLGQGRPDLIPEVGTDFIFAAFGEELGLIGTTALLLCYFLLIGRGLHIAARARDDFGQLLAAGLTVLFGLQVFVILGGVTRLLPLTGLTLPFISYGGSSLVANYALIALLLRVSAAGERTAGRMTRPLRIVAIVMFALFGALFINLNYLQVLRAEDLADDNRNTRKLIEEYGRQRGSMIVGRGEQQIEIARSVETEGRYKYQRRYPDGALYAHLTGFYSIVYGRAGLEDTANDLLVGEAPEAALRNISDYLAGREPQGDDVVLTIEPQVQEAARNALGDREGAVVALDPQTGGLLAVYANPTYDPNELSSFDREAATRYWESSEEMRRNGALREIYPPGSTFKLVTAAAALEDGVTPETTFPDPQTYTPPQTTVGIPNFGGGLCNDGQPITLTQSLAVSCNTVFARLGNRVGSDGLVAQAQRFGLNGEWDSQIPFVPSAIPDQLDAPATAQSAIGQRDVRVTPLQMAMITGAIANDGVLLEPRVVDRVQGFDGRVARELEPEPLSLGGAAGGQAVSPQTAADLQDMMTEVVANGSGGAAAIDGVEVAGKTGTAQVGEGTNPTVWFVGFAPVEDPQIAVAVVVPDGGDVGAEATGGAVAAPIAREVLEAGLE